MSMLARTRPIALAATLLALPLAVRADPPVVAPGECLYLTGAPAGAPAATEEERVEGSEVAPGCTLPHGVELNRDGDDMVQAWILAHPAAATPLAVCKVEGWVGHAFATAAEFQGPVRAWLTIGGSYNGSLLGGSDPGSTNVVIAARVVEMPDTERVRVARSVVGEVDSFITGPVLSGAEFAVRIPCDLRPGRTYSVELSLRADGWLDIQSIDFGMTPGSGFARYDSIEVCLGQAGTATGGEATASLERDLYERRCMPGLWLPGADGGRLEEARDLVATRLAQAAVSEAPGVNERLAAQRLEEADAHVADGDYQAACRSLSLGLHALTTP